MHRPWPTPEAIQTPTATPPQRGSLFLWHTAHQATLWSPTLTPHRDAFLHHLTARGKNHCEMGLLAGIILFWLACLNIGWDCLSCNGLWNRLTSGNFHCFSEATDSPLGQPLTAGKCLSLGLCKGTVNMFSLLQKLHGMGVSLVSTLTTRCTAHCLPLTHWGRHKMATISQTTFSNAFSWIKSFNCD